MDYSEDLAKALKLADAADEIALKYYLKNNLKFTNKPDNSPVTQADTETEAKLCNIVTKEFGDSYYGEEGADSITNNRRWLVDPIDGTKNFMRGFPVWGSLISLKINDEVVVASVSAPALGRRWWASKNSGAFTKDVNDEKRKLTVSKVDKIKDSFLLNGDFNSYRKMGLNPDLVYKLLKSAWRHRAPGDFMGYMMVAEGACDGYIEVPSNLWDVEAPRFIVEQAGGRIWTNPNETETIKQRRLALATNGLIEQEILKRLGLA